IENGGVNPSNVQRLIAQPPPEIAKANPPIPTKVASSRRKPSRSKSAAPAAAPKTGPYKFVNNYVEGGIWAGGNTANSEIRRNDLGHTNSGLQNAGKADKVFLEDNVVHSTEGGNGIIIQNLPGGELSNVTARGNIVLG